MPGRLSAMEFPPVSSGELRLDLRPWLVNVTLPMFACDSAGPPGGTALSHANIGKVTLTSQGLRSSLSSPELTGGNSMADSLPGIRYSIVVPVFNEAAVLPILL